MDLNDPVHVVLIIVAGLVVLLGLIYVLASRNHSIDLHEQEPEDPRPYGKPRRKPQAGHRTPPGWTDPPA